MFSIENLCVSYGSVEVIKEISLSVDQGEIVAMVGANGAGKSTVLKTISGLVPSQSGSISFLGSSLEKQSAAAITRAGISHVPEGRRVFTDMSVKENLLVGAFQRNDKNEINNDLDFVYEHFPRLRERETQMAQTLSGGEQQMLAIGRAMMSNPKMILMDEPTLGLAPLICKQIANIVVQLNAMGKTIILVEQNARLALGVSHRGYVLEKGTITLTGTGKELLNNEDVKKAYLGAA